MESNLCGSSNQVSGSDNVNLNEATPAETSVEVHEAPDVSAQSVECDSAISSTTPDKFTENLNEVERNLLNMEGNETEDFFTKELNISGVPTEKITENVEDIVQDLENLLGESDDSYRFSRESFDSAKLTESFDEVNSSSTSKFTKDNSSSSSKQLNLLQHVDITASNSNTQEQEEINKIKENREVPMMEELKESESLITKISENVYPPSETTENVIEVTPSLELKETEQRENMTENVVTLEQSPSETVLAVNELMEQAFTGLNQEVCLELNLNENESAMEVDEPIIKTAGEQSATEESKPLEELSEPSNLHVIQSVDVEEKLSETKIIEIATENVNHVEATEPVLEDVEVKESLVEDELVIIQENLDGNLEPETTSNEFGMETENQELQEAKLDLSEPVQEIECDRFQVANESLEPILNAAVEDVPSFESSEIIQGIETIEKEHIEAQEPSNKSEVAFETIQNMGEDLQPPIKLVQETSENTQEQEDPILEKPELSPENITENQEVKESGTSISEGNIEKEEMEPMKESPEANVIQEIVEIDNSLTEAAQSQTLEESLPELSTEEVSCVAESDDRNVLEVENSSSEPFPVLETIMEESGIVTSTSSEMQLVSNLEIERQNDTEMFVEPLQDNASQLLEELIKDSGISDGFNTLLDENNDKDMLTEIVDVQLPSQVEENLISDQEDLQVPAEETEMGMLDENLINKQPQDLPTPAEEIKIDIPSQSLDVEMQEESIEIQGQIEEEKENILSTEDVGGILDVLTETANDTISETQIVDSSIPDISTSTEKHNILHTEIQLSHSVESIETQNNQDAKLLEIVYEEEMKQDQDLESVQINQSQDLKLQETNQSRDLEVTETDQDMEIVKSEENDVLEPSSAEKVNLVQPLTVQVDEENSTEVIQQAEEKKPASETRTEKEVKPEVDTVSGSTEQVTRAPLKMTITKSDNVHSILKIYDPNENQEQLSPKKVVKSVASSSTEEDQVIPKITIKAVLTSPEIQHSPKSSKSFKSQSLELHEKQCSPRSSKSSSAGSPRITIKPVIKPETLSPLKLTLKPYPKLEETQGSPKLNIKPVVKPEESCLEVIHSPKITIKPIIKPPEECILEEKSSTRVRSAIKLEDSREDPHHEEKHSPRITIKPVVKSQEELKEESQIEEKHSPKITIKPIVKPEELVREESHLEGRHSPKITIKPIVRPPDENEEQERPAKIIIKPVVKPEEEKQTPKVTIKPIVRPCDSNKICEGETSRISTRHLRKDEIVYVENKHSPRITIKPVIKSSDENVRQTLESKSGARIVTEKTSDERHSPRITFKPIMKPDNESENIHSPRITIKPVLKPESEQSEKYVTQPLKLNIKPVVKPESSSPKVTIKPITKTAEPESDLTELVDFEEQIKQERIVLKIAKSGKKDKELEKLKKIKVKLSKEHGGHARIIPQTAKRSASVEGLSESKHFKPELFPEVSLSLVSSTVHSPDTPSSSTEFKKESAPHIEVFAVQNKDSTIDLTMDDDADPLADIPVFQIAVDTATVSSGSSVQTTPEVPVAPRKRGRPRKVPLQVREEFKDTKEDDVQPAVIVPSRPKRSCRGASVKEALGIKPRKPRATPAVRGGRGGKRAAVATTRAPPAKKSRESKTPSKAKLQKDDVVVIDEDESKESELQAEAKEEETKDVEFKQVPVPAELAAREVVIYEEETRMSSENSSRAQTPAKQVLTSTAEGVEESQSSVQSNTTTESGEKVQKARKGPRLEVHQEPEGEIISADKLAEYSWGGGGPYMLQEQVAQFLGIKSFKRKYPGIQRRPVDMQERDFIRESCLASEAMCDMGLTAVRSEDILDIMYTDFQHKYEEYCKHQRDRQAKDVSNKQKALSLAASQEKNKLDIVEQAVQSAYQWNANFNKARKEQRRACMDLQTFTVHFPKGKMKQVNRIPVGNYPLALVPGQFTDYYKQYNTYELANLPLNTMGCKPLSLNNLSHDTEESQSDGSGSDSDSSSSDSDSSDSSSGAEDCKMCRRTAAVSARKVLVH